MNGMRRPYIKYKERYVCIYINASTLSPPFVPIPIHTGEMNRVRNQNITSLSIIAYTSSVMVSYTYTFRGPPKPVLYVIRPRKRSERTMRQKYEEVYLDVLRIMVNDYRAVFCYFLIEP